MRINLENLVGSAKLQAVEAFENSSQLISPVVVRGKTINFYTSSLRQLWQAYGLEYIEPELLDFIDTFERESVFYDIGASNGIFALYCSVSGHHVHAFEPESQNYSLLERNSFQNYENIKFPCKCYNIALADKNEMGNLFISKYEPAGHLKILDKPIKVMEDTPFVPAYVQPVIKFSLDNFIKFSDIDFPDYIKIDVDGSEIEVLKGAKNTIKNPKLKKVFIEVEEGGKISSFVSSYFTELGFVLKSSYQVQNYVGLSNYIYERVD